MFIKTHLQVWCAFCIIFPQVIVWLRKYCTSTIYWPFILVLSIFLYIIAHVDPDLFEAIIYKDFLECFIWFYASCLLGVWKENDFTPLTESKKVATMLFLVISSFIYYLVTCFIIYFSWKLLFFVVILVRVAYVDIKKKFLKRDFLYYKGNNLYYYSFGIDNRIDNEEYKNIRLFRMYDAYNDDYGKRSQLFYQYRRFYYCVNFDRFNHLCAQLDEYVATLVFKPSLLKFANLNRENTLSLTMKLIGLSWFILNLTLWSCLYFTVIDHGFKYHIMFNILYFFILYFWCYVRPHDPRLEGSIELGPFYMLMWNFSQKLVFYSVPVLSCYLSTIFFEKEKIFRARSNSTLCQNQSDELAQKLSEYDNVLYILNLEIMDHREFNYRINNLFLIGSVVFIIITLLSFLWRSILSCSFLFINEETSVFKID